MSDIKNPFATLPKWTQSGEKIDEVETVKKDYPLIPEGFYPGTIESIDVRTAKKNNKPYLNFMFRLENNRVVFACFFPFHGVGASKGFEYALRNIGLTPEQREGFQMDQLKALFGVKVNLLIKHEDDSYLGKKKEAVKVMPNKFADKVDITAKLEELASEIDEVECEEFPE